MENAEAILDHKLGSAAKCTHLPALICHPNLLPLSFLHLRSQSLDPDSILATSDTDLIGTMGNVLRGVIAGRAGLSREEAMLPKPKPTNAQAKPGSAKPKSKTKSKLSATDPLALLAQPARPTPSRPDTSGLANFVRDGVPKAAVNAVPSVPSLASASAPAHSATPASALVSGLATASPSAANGVRSSLPLDRRLRRLLKQVGQPEHQPLPGHAPGPQVGASDALSTTHSHAHLLSSRFSSSSSAPRRGRLTLPTSLLHSKGSTTMSRPPQIGCCEHKSSKEFLSSKKLLSRKNCLSSRRQW